MHTSKTVIATNMIIGKTLSIIGYVMGGLMLLGTIMMLAEMISAGEEIAVMGIIAVLVWLALFVFMIIKGAQIKHLLIRYKKYVVLISAQQMTSLENIAASTNQTIDFVKNDLQKMIKKNFFANAMIDISSNEIIIGEKTMAASFQAQVKPEVEMETYTCTGCDATGNKPKGSRATCEYCGSPV